MMTFRIPSSSSLPLVHRCAASYALPHGSRGGSDRSRMGDALHMHFDHRCKLGITEAMTRLDGIAKAHEMTPRETSIFLARARHFDFVPPNGSFGEVALVLLEDGTVTRMVGGKGSYDWPEGAVAGGTLDAMWSEPEPLDLSDPEHPRCPPGSVLWPIDLKTGEETYVEPVESNQQVLTNALLAARWTGAQRVAPGVLFWRKGMGEWDLPLTPDGKLAPWGEVDMRRQERVVRELMSRVREQQRRATAGEALEMVEGVHCTYCPARASCSEHTAILKHVATGEIVLPGAAPLSQEQRVWLASRLAAAERFVKQWRGSLIADVKVNGEIPLEDGNVWGGHPRKKTAILIEHALPILREELGDELAEHAVNRSLTNESVEDAVKESLQGKRGAAPIVRRIFAKLGAAGALVTDVSTQYGAHKPKGADLALQDDDVEDLD